MVAMVQRGPQLHSHTQRHASIAYIRRRTAATQTPAALPCGRSSERRRWSRNREAGETQGRQVGISRLENILRGRFDNRPVGDRVAKLDKISRETPHYQSFLLCPTHFQIHERPKRGQGNRRP